MGMIYKRGAVFWIKYYRNGKCFASDGNGLLNRVI